MSDIWILIIVLLLCIVGIMGCIVPGLPGPPLNYGALLLVQFKYEPFSLTFMIVWASIVVLAGIMNYFIPIWFAKRYGASKYGVWGSIIGMVIGIFFTPIGMVLGMLLGAIIGELISGADGVKSGLATFAGTMLSMGMQLIVAGTLSVYIFVELSRMNFNF